MKIIPGNRTIFFLWPHVSLETSSSIKAKIVEISRPTRSFYMMVCLSTIIAALGLLANNIAVVIGAMLIAPLMGPIFGVSLSLFSGDYKLLKYSVLAEFLGVILSIGLGFLIGLIPFRPEFGFEVIARTQPTIYDLIIALASGLAGAYALINEKISATIPGVAIATALVPPLTTCGLCLATGSWGLASGALLLFAVNFLAIEIAAATVFILTGVIKFNKKEASLANLFGKLGISLLGLVFVAIFMTQTFVKIIENRRLLDQIKVNMGKQVTTVAGARLSEVHFQKDGDTIQVITEVLSPREFEPEKIMKMEAVLEKEVGIKSRLIVRSLISKDADKNGPVFISEEEKLRRSKVIEENQFLSNISKILNEEFKLLPGTQMIDMYNYSDEGNITITVVVRTPSEVTPEQVLGLENALNQALGANNIKLVVRSLQTKDADAQRYLYEEKDKSEPLKGKQLELHQNLDSILRAEIANLINGASLLEFRYTIQDEDFLILAVVRTPSTLTPDQVKQIEDNLRKGFDPRVKLVVRSVLGAETSTEGYLNIFDEAVFKN